jgi:hypothetical protein
VSEKNLLAASLQALPELLGHFRNFSGYNFLYVAKISVMQPSKKGALTPLSPLSSLASFHMKAQKRSNRMHPSKALIMTALLQIARHSTKALSFVPSRSVALQKASSVRTNGWIRMWGEEDRPSG